jgi:hypothetical protein
VQALVKSNDQKMLQKSYRKKVKQNKNYNSVNTLNKPLIVIYCISVLDSILSTQEFLTASANARAVNILKWIKCD